MDWISYRWTKHAIAYGLPFTNNERSRQNLKHHLSQLLIRQHIFRSQLLQHHPKHCQYLPRWNNKAYWTVPEFLPDRLGTDEYSSGPSLPRCYLRILEMTRREAATTRIGFVIAETFGYFVVTVHVVHVSIPVSHRRQLVEIDKRKLGSLHFECVSPLSFYFRIWRRFDMCQR